MNVYVMSGLFVNKVRGPGKRPWMTGRREYHRRGESCRGDARAGSWRGDCGVVAPPLGLPSLQFPSKSGCRNFLE